MSQPTTTDVWKEFGENQVTHSAAHHLLAILELVQLRGYARVIDVARFLNITTGSASTNLKTMKQKGLVIEDENRFLSLSDNGRKIAEVILKRRTTIENFLVKVLHVAKDQAHIDACKTEHLLSPETTAKMESFIVKAGE
ncbi:MAG TPA: metal-dependent transcriptional regulator [Oligoflexia bacterium]|mgnify:FL=1|nr:metal-dependent transcriptional regulator [Oligoflexia bacterium]